MWFITLTYDDLFPAHAGVILRATVTAKRKGTFPRTRGGDPWSVGVSDYLKFFSPHTRG